MAAPTREENPCQLGAVYTWVLLGLCNLFACYQGQSGLHTRHRATSVVGPNSEMQYDPNVICFHLRFRETAVKARPASRSGFLSGRVDLGPV